LRLSRRFYSTLLLPESYAADPRLCVPRRDSGQPPSAMPPWTPIPGARGPRTRPEKTTDGAGRSGYADRPPSFLPLTSHFRLSACCRRRPRHQGPALPRDPYTLNYALRVLIQSLQPVRYASAHRLLPLNRTPGRGSKSNTNALASLAKLSAGRVTSPALITMRSLPAAAATPLSRCNSGSLRRSSWPARHTT
jgi:hypothetical protein